MADLNLGELRITSPAFANGEPIPARYTSSGEDLSPELRWERVPDGTKELVLILHDPDAPLTDGFTHLAAHGIDPSTGGLDEGALVAGGNGSAQADGGPVLDQNETGAPGYMGPAPPPGHGPHHYFFHLYALDQRLDADHPLTRRELLERMHGHILEQARLVGTFENPG